MQMLEILIAAYLSVTLLAVCLTYREQCRSQQDNMVFNLAGYLACAMWPIVCAVFFVALQRRSA